MKTKSMEKARTVGIITGILFGIGSIIPGVFSACPCCGFAANIVAVIAALFLGGLAGLIAAIIADWAKISYENGIGTGARLGFKAGITAGLIGGAVATIVTGLSWIGLLQAPSADADVASGAAMWVGTQAFMNLIIVPLCAALPGAFWGVIVGAIRRRQDGVEEPTIIPPGRADRGSIFDYGAFFGIERPPPQKHPSDDPTLLSLLDNIKQRAIRIGTGVRIEPKTVPPPWLEPETELEPELDSERDTRPDLGMNSLVPLINWAALAEKLRPVLSIMLRVVRNTGAFLQQRVIRLLGRVDWKRHFGTFLQYTRNLVVRIIKGIKTLFRQRKISKPVLIALGLTAGLVIVAVGIALLVTVLILPSSEDQNENLAVSFGSEGQSQVFVPQIQPGESEARSQPVQPQPQFASLVPPESPEDEPSPEQPSLEKAAPPTVPADSIEEPAELSSTPPGEILSSSVEVQEEVHDWWCLCYSERINDVSTPATACRNTRVECQRLANKVRASRGTDWEKVKCYKISASHPEDVLGQQDHWEPSVYAGGGWWTKEGCLLSDKRLTSRSDASKRSALKQKGIKRGKITYGRSFHF